MEGIEQWKKTPEGMEYQKSLIKRKIIKKARKKK